MRRYTGRAHKIKGVLDLRAEKCFLYGKKDPEGRLAPLEAWDCDHLIFAFREENGLLKGIRTDYTEYSDWMHPFDLLPLPAGMVFGARILSVTNQEILAYGMFASKRLNENHILSGGKNKQCKVIKRYDDFILCKNLQSGNELKMNDLLYTDIHRKTPGLFGD